MKVTYDDILESLPQFDSNELVRLRNAVLTEMERQERVQPTARRVSVSAALANEREAKGAAARKRPE
jgi:hypothetical protein